MYFKVLHSITAISTSVLRIYRQPCTMSVQITETREENDQKPDEQKPEKRRE